MSCEVLSPYGGDAVLVIYSESQYCEMPVLVRDAKLIVSAVLQALLHSARLSNETLDWRYALEPIEK